MKNEQVKSKPKKAKAKTFTKKKGRFIICITPLNSTKDAYYWGINV